MSRSKMTQKSTWGICTRRAGKLCSARSLLYRRLRLREWAHFLAFFAIYKIFTPSHRSGLKISAKNCHIFFLFRQKNLKNLQNFGQNLANFHEISPEFHVNFEVLKGRGLPGFFRGSSRVLPDVLQFSSRPMPSTVRPFS